MRKTGGFFLESGPESLVGEGEVFRKRAVQTLRKTFGKLAGTAPIVFFGDYGNKEWAAYGRPFYPNTYLELAESLSKEGLVSSKFVIGKVHPQGVAVFPVSNGRIEFLPELADIFGISEETAFKAVLAEELTHGILPQADKFKCVPGKERPDYPKGSYGELVWELANRYGQKELVLAPAEFYGALGTGLLVPEAELSFRAYDAASGKSALGKRLSLEELSHYARHIPGHAARELTAKAGGAKKFLEKNPDALTLPPEQLFEKYVFPVQSPVYRI